MGADVIEALGRFRIVVKRDARRDHVDKSGAFVLDRRLDQRHQLGLVAREAARDIGGAQLQRHRDQVDRRVGVDGAAPCFRALVGGRRELALGQPVNAIVLDDIDHVDAAANAMGELAEADRGGIAIAGDPEIDQVAIGEIGAGQHRGHAPVHAVKAVRLAEEISRRLRRTADAGQFGNAMRRQRQLEAGLDDGGADRIMATAGAQCRHRALVVAMGVAQRVGWQFRVMQSRLGDIGHPDLNAITAAPS